MQTYTVTSPNTCGLVILPAGPVYVGAVGANTFAPDDSTFEEFETQDAAAARAKELDPGYDVNNIYGPLYLEPVNISDGTQNAYAGDTVVLNCEYSCGDCTVLYEWKNPGGLVIPNQTGSSLTIANVSEVHNGAYTCEVYAENDKGQSGSAAASFQVTVHPTI